MPEMGTSGLMSGDGKRGGRSASVLAPILDSTQEVRWVETPTVARPPTVQPDVEALMVRMARENTGHASNMS